MSFIVDNEVKDRVRSAVDIVDLVGSYTELRRQGRGFVAQCPWHDDRRPSLQVNPERQSWKCWVCDLGGDVYSWMMQREGVSFPEALRMLAERAGITLEPMQRAAISNFSHGANDDKKLLFDAMAWAVQQYHQFFMNAPEAEKAREYLIDRGLSNDSLQKFRIGYAPDSWNWLIDRAKSSAVSVKALEAVNTVVRNDRGSHYDRFRGRILFPIHDPQGRPIALGGRIVPGLSSDREQAKYINSTETRLYSKSHQLYGLDVARDMIGKKKQAIVVEGYTDVIMSHQHGIQNAVAVCGTALSESHIRLLRRYCDSVVLLLDGDDAGQRRTNEILELFIAAQMDLRVLTLPDGLDPCDYLLRSGGDELQRLLGTAVDALEHKITIECQGFDPLVDTHRASAALEQILGTIAKIPKMDPLMDQGASLRIEQILGRLGREFGLQVGQLRDRIRQLRAEGLKRTKEADKTTSAPSRSFKYSDLSPADCELFEILVSYPELVPLALERFPASSLGSDAARALLQVYTDLELAGYELHFNSVMSAMEEVSMKSLMVSIEEAASKKKQFSNWDAQQRLHSLCEKLSKQDQQAEDQQRMRILESKRLTEQEEMDLLRQVIEQARSRHGFFTNGEN